MKCFVNVRLFFHAVCSSSLCEPTTKESSPLLLSPCKISDAKRNIELRRKWILNPRPLIVCARFRGSVGKCENRFLWYRDRLLHKVWLHRPNRPRDLNIGCISHRILLKVDVDDNDTMGTNSISIAPNNQHENNVYRESISEYYEFLIDKLHKMDTVELFFEEMIPTFS